MLNIVREDITTLQVDAIVNAANGVGIMGSGVAGAIRRAGGPEVDKEAREACRTMMPDGSAYFTTAGDLDASYIIHAVTMMYPGTSYRGYEHEGMEIISSALLSSIKLARSLGVKSIAFPALGTGVGGLSKKDVAIKMVNILQQYKDDFDITICDVSSEFVQVAQEYYENKH
jgi:O-acetyl-ADP-ribose deacetylase (regulator of RNase III)